MKALESLLRKMHVHIFLHTFPGDSQSLGVNVDPFLVLKAR